MSSVIQALAVVVGIYFGLAELRRENEARENEVRRENEEKVAMSINLNDRFFEKDILEELQFIQEFAEKNDFSNVRAIVFQERTIQTQLAIAKIIRCMRRYLCSEGKEIDRFCDVLQQFADVAKNFDMKFIIFKEKFNIMAGAPFFYHEACVLARELMKPV